MLTRLARGVCLNWADADDDAVQECLVRVGLRRNRLNRSGEPVAYARTVVVRLSIDQARRRAKDPIGTQPGHPEQARPDQHWVEQGAWIEEVLATLSPQRRAAIALRFLANLTDAEIADHLHCSEATVRSHISRGLSRLRAHQQLDQREPG